tara:strand:+ start:8067 stop:8975 length:909 start_codon:yes stop_codon:yes gene_type:complete
MFKKIKGLIAAPYTPMKSSGEIDLNKISSYAKKLKKDSLSGVFICGTTGEGMFLTNDERKKIAEEWVKYQSEDFKIIVHVGTTSVVQSSDLANHAQKIGAFGTSSIGPVFLKPNDINDVVDFCKIIADSAPKIPFYYYHIPSVTGLNFSMSEMINFSKSKIENFAGIKFTHNDLVELKDCLKIDNGKWNIFFGQDELFLSALSLGVDSFVGSNYNYMGLLFNSIIESHRNKKIDDVMSKSIVALESISLVLKYYGPIVGGKQVMKLTGIDCGYCRSPLKKISEKQIKELEKSLRKLKSNLIF